MTTPRSFTNFVSALTALLAISGSVFLVNSAEAQPTPTGRMDPARMERMVDMHVERMAKAVDATPEQKSKLLAIAKAAQADIKPLHDQVRARMDKAMLESKEVLTPEQRTKWETQMKTMRDRMEKHMGDRGERAEKK